MAEVKFPITCPCCDGSGKQTITPRLFNTVTRKFDKEAPVDINCLWCGGEGQMNAAQKAQYDGYQALWCRCGNPSGKTSYFENEFQHGYLCHDCGKVYQIG